MRDESTDALLARWAELLRSRAGICDMHMSEFNVTYSGPNSSGEYVCEWHETGLLDDLISLFLRDVDYRIESIEATLRQRGVTVTRPARID